MENVQKDGSTLIAATANSISTTNLKTVDTSVINKSVDGEVNQNSVANCNKSFSSGISDSASDVPVTLPASENEKVLDNDKKSPNVSNSEMNDKQSVIDVVVEESVSDGNTVDPLSNSLDNSLKDDSVLSEGSSRMEQTLVSEKPAQVSGGKDVVDESTAKSDSLLAEMRQICNKTVQEEEAMDVDLSIAISDDESASKGSTTQVVESKNDNSELRDDSNLPSNSSVSESAGKNVAESGSNKLRSILEDTKDQDDSNPMLVLDESSTNMSESSTKFVVQDCDQDLSQDDVQELACVDPFAQTGEESMEVEEVGKKDSGESEEEKKVGDEDEETKNSNESVVKDGEEEDCDENKKEDNEKEIGSVEKKSEEKTDSIEESDKSGNEQIGEKTVEKDADEVNIDEAMEVDGKKMAAVEAVEVDDEEKEKEEEKRMEDVETDKSQSKDVNSSDKEVAEKASENSSSKEVEEDDDDDCVVVVEDGEKGRDECSVGKKDDKKNGEASKEGQNKKDEESEEGKKEKDEESKESEKEKDGESSVSEKKKDGESKEGEKKKDDETSSKVGGKGLESSTSDKVAESSGDKDKPSPTSEDDATKKNTDVESSKEKTNNKEGLVGAAEIEIDEDICIIPDTVRLPPGEGKSSNSATSTPSTATPLASTSSTPSGSGAKVLNEVSSLTNRIKVVKMEMEVKQETSTPSRPKRQAATKADAQIKATVKELEKFNEEEGEKENEDEIDENIQLCKQCVKVKPCKFNILSKNKVVSHLCSEECALAYKNALLAADKARGVGAVAGTGVSDGGANGGGNVHINEAGEFVRSCSQCRNALEPGESILSWETMDFCNEDCLGKYQNCLGSHCAYCKKGVQQTSLGKYCVRFGYHIRQFCSSSCLEEYKRGLKVCSFCQKDISSLETGFLAPVGDKGTFKDFCTQQCMEQYDRLSNNQPAPTEMHSCGVCNENKVVGVQVLVDSKLNKLCSEVCFAAFKFVNEVTVDQCDMCHKYFDRTTLRSDSLTVYYDDNQHNFCCKTCMNAYILGKRKIVPCNWCKVKKYNFDMIKRVLETGQTLMMCSLNCLTLYKVSINAVSSRRIKCDQCSSVSQAQYHLTMSDATIRNFCTYPCVMKFQGQYSKNPITLPGGQQTPIPTGGPKRAVTVASPKDTRPSVPVISSVTSLATTNGQTATGLLQPKTVNSLSPVVSSVTTVAKSPAVVSVVSGAANSTATALTTTCNNYVIIREKNPPKMSNKCTSFRPTTHTKGVSCRPHATTQAMQTDVSGGDGKTVIIPIPVPVYIPVPMHMYTMPTPVPIPFPIPVPVPIFIPTTRNSAEGIMDEIKRIHEKIPTDPFEAELLMMAQAVAERKDESGSEAGGAAHSVGGGASPDRRSDSPAEDMAGEVDADSGASLPISCELASPTDDCEDLDAKLTPTTITAPASSRGLPRHFLAAGTSDNDEDVDDPDPVETPPVTRKRGRPSLRGSGSASAKRGRRSTSSNHLAASRTNTTPTPPTAPVMKFMLGVQAYKQWLLARNSNVKNADTAESSPKHTKQLKSDLLQQTPEELNYSLTLFVREARKPSGDPYPPDTSFYFCLGIQHYLFDNGRIENIFTDAYFDTFTDALQEVVQNFPSAVSDAQVIVTRVEEEHLWESKQLGAHSPHVLLFTLMFFNTKYFNLVTVEDHMKLSFSHIMKHWKKGGNSAPVTGTRNVLLRYYPSGDSTKRTSTGKRLTYEQHENEDDPLRCPVKLYEFYLSKCPESVKSKGDLFYLQPERSCVPDSPVWYSTQGISEEALSKVLNRIKMVKEINVALLKS